MDDIHDIKGNTGSLDPRSKIIVTLLFIIGVAISIDYFQVFLYLVLFIPIAFLFKPRIVFLRRLLLSMPFILFICLMLFLGIRSPQVTINVFGYTRTYKKIFFVGFIAYRYSIIVLFNHLLIHSEDSNSDIIEALASFKLGKSLVSILILIKRLSTRIQDDYNKMSYAALAKGAYSTGILKSTYNKLVVLGRTLGKSLSYSNNISQTLIARGFHGDFTPTTRPYTTEGIMVVIISAIFFVEISLIPWLR